MSSTQTFYPFKECHKPAHYTTNPANHTFVECNHGYQHYGPYECEKSQYPDKYEQFRFWVMGQPRPSCEIGKGCNSYTATQNCETLDGNASATYWKGCGNEVDNMLPKFPGYNRNARYTNVRGALW